MSTVTTQDLEASMMELGESISDYVMEHGQGQPWQKRLRVPLPLEVVDVDVHRLQGGYLLTAFRRNPETDRLIETKQQIRWNGKLEGPGGLYIFRTYGFDENHDVAGSAWSFLRSIAPEYTMFLEELKAVLIPV